MIGVQRGETERKKAPEQEAKKENSKWRRGKSKWGIKVEEMWL